MLNILGKVFELIIIGRLIPELELSANQHGFRKGHSTTDAINKVRSAIIQNLNIDKKHRPSMAILTLDIKNAFNSLSWRDIHESLLEKNIPSYIIRIILNYLTDRYITINGLILEINSGVQQGSCIGPHLWNICYDKIVNLTTKTVAEKIAYADDLAIIIETKTRRELSINTNQETTEINDELVKAKLALEPTKTEALEIVGKRKKKRRRFKLKVIDHPITPTPFMRYLGVWLDEDGTLNTHFKKISEKASSAIKSFSCILPNIDGPTFMKRKLIASAILSIIFYAVNVWAADEVSIKNKKLLTKTIRPLKQRICMAYRTASNTALDMISGIPPINHLIRERLNLWYKEADKMDIKASVRRDWISEWQQDPSKDTWLKKLIVDPEKWLTRKFGDVNFFLTQALTGHGAFNQYLHRMKISPSPYCPYCPNIVDTPEHSLFKCDKFISERNLLEIEIKKTFTIENFQNCLLESKDTWLKICTYIKTVLNNKKEAIDKLIYADVCQRADSGVANSNPS